jgi:hypothetical protein
MMVYGKRNTALNPAVGNKNLIIIRNLLKIKDAFRKEKKRC